MYSTVSVRHVPVRMPHAVVTAINSRRGRLWIGGVGWPYPEQAPDAAFHAADDTTDGAADHGPNRSSRLAAHVSAVGCPIGNTLRLRRKRASK
jgi:hypothetical protein